MINDPKRIAALILARMACCDGIIDPGERELLSELTGFPPFGTYMDDLLTEAKDYPLEALADRLESYADRFFIALRAYMMANVDADFDVSEERFFKRLVNWLCIDAKDRDLIRKTHQQLHKTDEAPDPRIRELYRQSSFYTTENG